MGKADLFAALMLELPTETAAANRELAGLADDLRTTSLAEPIARADAHAALDLVRTDPAAAQARGRFDAFVTT